MATFWQDPENDEREGTREEEIDSENITNDADGITPRYRPRSRGE